MLPIPDLKTVQNWLLQARIEYQLQSHAEQTVIQLPGIAQMLQLDDAALVLSEQRLCYHLSRSLDLALLPLLMDELRLLNSQAFATKIVVDFNMADDLLLQLSHTQFCGAGLNYAQFLHFMQQVEAEVLEIVQHLQTLEHSLQSEQDLAQQGTTLILH